MPKSEITGDWHQIKNTALLTFDQVTVVMYRHSYKALLHLRFQVYQYNSSYLPFHLRDTFIQGEHKKDFPVSFALNGELRTGLATDKLTWRR